jgi:hypothetical protein
MTKNDTTTESTGSQQGTSAVARPLLKRPAPLAIGSGIELTVLRRVDAKLRQAGATLPAPPATGTAEGAITTGMCLALCLVDDEINTLERDAELAIVTSIMTSEQFAEVDQRRTELRKRAGSASVSIGSVCPPAPPGTGVAAAEIAQLLNDLERAGTKATGEMIGICAQASAVIQALQAGRGASQVGDDDTLDAARYRWLRRQDWWKVGLVKTMCAGKGTFQYLSGGLDAEIDRQRRQA